MVERTKDAVDVHVGQMIRALRKTAGVSQERLAIAVGVTFQQVQKYERAANRISAGRLVRIARVLDAPLAAFFPEVDERGLVASLGAAEQLALMDGGQELARAFLVMGPERRRALLNVADALCSTQPAEEPGAAYVSGGDLEERRHVAR